jgi:hypothetical protein
MDKRASRRNRVSRTGNEFDGGVINCIVRNLSSTGAMLDVASPVGIPEHFTLIQSADGHFTPCHENPLANSWGPT